MAAQCLDLDLHVGKQRQAQQQVMQFGGAGDVENADVGIASDYPPQMPPLAAALQTVGQFALAAFERIGGFLRHAVRQLHVHGDFKQHLVSCSVWSLRVEYFPDSAQGSDIVVLLFLSRRRKLMRASSSS